MRWRRRVLKDDEETKERGWTEGRSAGASLIRYLHQHWARESRSFHCCPGGESEDESEDES